jgi:bacillithiol synthase
MEELEQVIESAPETLSANVLLRPVVQDSLLPTAAYIGGPAEIVYFAQAEVVYRRLGVRMPAIVPRAGFTLVEPAIARLLKKYHLEIGDLFRGRQRVRAAMERQYLSRGLAQQFTRGGKNLNRVLKNLRRPLGILDLSLGGALNTAERKMLYQFEKLRGKAGRAANFRTGVLDRHERALLDALYPHRELQERTLNLLPFLARHDLDLLAELERRALPGGTNHQVLFL